MILLPIVSTKYRAPVGAWCESKCITHLHLEFIMLCKGSMQYQLRRMNTSQTVDRQSHSVVNHNHARLMHVMSWGRTEGVLRFYIFGEDSASAYVLCHQTSTVLEFQARDRRGFRGSDGEFEGQSMSISD